MTNEQFGGIARAVIAALGGFAVGKGYIDEATATALGGGALTIAVAVWSVWSKRAAK